MSVLLACLCLYTKCVQCPQKPEEGSRLLDFQLHLIESHIPCWELNQEHLQEQMLLTTHQPVQPLHVDILDASEISKVFHPIGISTVTTVVWDPRL